MNFAASFCVDAELLGEAEGRKAVNHAEIDDFGDAAMLARLRERRDAENFLRGARVDVFAAAESFDQDGILGKMREDAQLDLRIIRGKQQAARRRRRKRREFRGQARCGWEYSANSDSRS